MNHQAIIAVVTETITIPGADKIHIARVLGENCIVSKGIQEGFVGVLFPADLQLSEEFCYENNLNRHSTENKDNTKSGFFESSRRVRVQPFLKVKSHALFVGVSSLEYTGGVAGKPIGFSFDELNGHKICQKYVSEATKKAIGNVNRPKQAKKDFAPYEIAPQEVYDGDVEKLMAKVEAITERPDMLSEDYIDSSHPTEGVIIRVDSGQLTPTFLKSKAYYFRTMEGLCEAADIEDAS